MGHGSSPPPGRLTIDPDATCVSTYGKQKESSTFSYQGEVQMSPLVGVVGETGDVLAIRARGGNASPRKKLATFCDECVAAIPTEARDRYEPWIRIDSAGFSRAVVEVAETSYRFATADLRLVVRRQAKSTGEQLSFDDLGGFGFFAFVTNAGPEHSAVALDLHHRRRGGRPKRPSAS